MSAVTEVRAVTRGSGATLTALMSGSVVLAGRICRCAGRALAWSWDQASVDVQATAAAQAKADKVAQAAKARASKSKKAGPDEGEAEDELEETEEETAPPVKPPVRRPALEALAMLALGGFLAVGAVGTLGTVAWPYLQQLAPWRGVIAGVGGLAWMVAAWMVAPTPASVEDEDQEHEDVREGEDEGGLSPGDLLGRHVLAELAELEKLGRPGLHVTALITSAEEAGLLAPGATDKTAMRAWLETHRIPVTKSVKVAGAVDYGVRVDRVREALGMGPTEALQAAFGGAPTTTRDAPDEDDIEALVESAQVPVQAPCLTLLKPLPDGDAQQSAQGAA